MGQKTYYITARFMYQLPADLNEREDLYGTSDPMECIKIDFDNDPAATLLDFADGFDILEVG